MGLHGTWASVCIWRCWINAEYVKSTSTCFLKHRCAHLIVHSVDSSAARRLAAKSIVTPIASWRMINMHSRLAASWRYRKPELCAGMGHAKLWVIVHSYWSAYSCIHCHDVHDIMIMSIGHAYAHVIMRHVLLTTKQDLQNSHIHWAFTSHNSGHWDKY